jgi:hypothetical protein
LQPFLQCAGIGIADQDESAALLVRDAENCLDGVADFNAVFVLDAGMGENPSRCCDGPPAETIRKASLDFLPLEGTITPEPSIHGRRLHIEQDHLEGSLRAGESFDLFYKPPGPLRAINHG